MTLRKLPFVITVFACNKEMLNAPTILRAYNAMITCLEAGDNGSVTRDSSESDLDRSINPVFPAELSCPWA